MRNNTLTLALLVLSGIAIFAACMLGSTKMELPRFISAVLNISSSADSIVIWQIRLPRALAAFVVGAALGASGAALQGLLRNPLAEPGVLGVTSTAALAATFAIYYGFAARSPYLLPIYSIAGALAATVLLAVSAIRIKSVVTLILLGVGLSSLSTAIMSVLLNLAPHPVSLSEMINWLLGSVANKSMNDLNVALPFVVVGLTILFINRRGLSALTLGEEAAAGVGLNLRSLRIAVVIGSGIATGASVALAGAIGFVGIIAPHVVRPFVGYDPARTLVPSAILAGLILVVADIGVRLIPTSSELKLGVVAALIGAPVFIWIAVERRIHHG